MTPKNDAPTLLELDDLMTKSEAAFGERHERRIDLPIEQIWPAALELRAAEIRTMGPLMSLRKLPGRMLRKGESPELVEDQAFLDGFADGGFVVLRCDSKPDDGRALVLFGAAGKFWKPIGNQPVTFEHPDQLVDFDTPDHAVLGATIEAIDRGGYTDLITETRVRGTDRASTRRFAPYWALIRPFSGLIRRSWLAAIDRRAKIDA